jgi:uncharacterized membrane protein YbhN (UPF0104 family)
LLALAVLSLIALALRERLHDTWQEIRRAQWRWLVGSVLLLPIMYVAILTSQRLLVRSLSGYRLTWRQAIAVAWVPLAGRYVPGKVVAAGTAIVLLKRLGVPATLGLAVLVLLDAFPLLTGGLLAAGLWMRDGVRVDQPEPNTLLLWLLVAAPLVLNPWSLTWLIGLLLRLLRRDTLPRRLTWRDVGGPVAMSLVQWAANGAAIWFALNAFGRATVPDLPYVVGATAMTMCISYFGGVVTPAGLGVREAAMIPLLAPLVGVPAATATAAFMRINHTFVELILCGIGLVALRSSPCRSSTNTS